ncbi:MAG TPA: class II fructose-bisphosphate aldolase [Dongiaceae bacterium]|nr:class II fructose-bisphosphate aldolase [Dongiaceae bacterium]
MPLVSMSGLLADARAGGYALCYCESWNLESLQAVVEGAEAMRSPIIAGFNGGFLRHASRARPERLAYYGALSAALAASAVPTAFLLNETDDLAQIEEGLEQGFNAVMVEADLLAPEQYLDLVKKVVRIAHARSASVEAQVGRLPHGCGGGPGHGETTNPEAARAFVEKTGVDALGVSIGNVHILTRGKASIDVESLARIREQVDVPLVVHGGTGFPAEFAARVIGLGVAKFNFGTNLKQAYLAALREKLAPYAEPMNPHFFLGMGGQEDILVAARAAVKRQVQGLIETYGFAGAPLRPGAARLA